MNINELLEDIEDETNTGHFEAKGEKNIRKIEDEDWYDDIDQDDDKDEF